ncbi:hypothetical protein [Acidihalobacter ferrooxydans]|uniref:hypothetical protein n=1 Tax=Acidihalobacter ferrooxydans TaxID=1765967 RepID=UPI0012EC7E49|nr:hypothetical protein [Acidihalobacter ferrooxydans]
MELWKIHKYAETASLAELLAKERELDAAIKTGKVVSTNAEHVLRLLREYIELKQMFG